MPRNYTDTDFEYFNDSVRVDCNNDYLLDPEDDPFGEEEKVIVTVQRSYVDDRGCYHHIEDRSFIASVDEAPLMQSQPEWEPYWIKRIKEQKGAKAYYFSLEWEGISTKAKERDCYKCQDCGGSSNLNVHHLTYKRFKNEELEDLVTLCRDCHEKAHRDPLSRFRVQDNQEKA